MKEMGYSERYQHAHQFKDAIVYMDWLPPLPVGRRYYHPTERGLEKRIGEHMEGIRITRESRQE